MSQVRRPYLEQYLLPQLDLVGLKPQDVGHAHERRSGRGARGVRWGGEVRASCGRGGWGHTEEVHLCRVSARGLTEAVRRADTSAWGRYEELWGRRGGRGPARGGGA